MYQPLAWTTRQREHRQIAINRHQSNRSGSNSSLDGPRPRQLASSISLAQRAASIRPQLLPALLNMAAQQPNVGAANSAGDVAHRGAAARTSFGINGSGVKIGVLSDSFDNRGTAAA